MNKFVILGNDSLINIASHSSVNCISDYIRNCCSAHALAADKDLEGRVANVFAVHVVRRF